MELRIFKKYNQWLSGSFTGHQIRFRPGLRPGPRWGSLQRSPGPLAGLRGPTSEGEAREEGKERGRERRGKKGRDRPLRKFLYPPMFCTVLSISASNVKCGCTC